MTVKYGITLANAMLDAYESNIGTSPRLKIFDGTLPAACATADDGVVLADINLPSDWMAAASAGSKAKSGTWQDASADATGSADYYRIYTSGGTCVEQGTVSLAGGGGDMILDSLSFTAGQSFTITTFTKSMSV